MKDVLHGKAYEHDGGAVNMKDVLHGKAHEHEGRTAHTL